MIQTTNDDPAVYGTKTGPPITWGIDRCVRYVWDGWHLSLSYRTTSNGAYLGPDQSFAWGPDLSSSYGGAGGIGGLVAYCDDDFDANNHPDPDLGPMYPIYDGNGNVVRMCRFAAVGSGGFGGVECRTAAAYEYGPFGEALSVTGEDLGPSGGGGQGQRNPFRFSTKYTDAETGLVYYGYRYYSPGMGRWVSRDPIHDDTFIDLNFESRAAVFFRSSRDHTCVYPAFANDPVGRFDLLGLLDGSATCDKRVCGPNVTRQLVAVLARVAPTRNRWTILQRLRACHAIFDVIGRDPARGNSRTYRNAWDIDQLFISNWINAAPYSPPCAVPNITPPKGSPDGCADTVQVHDQCFYTGSVNYALFGKIMSICGYRRHHVTAAVRAYKGPIPFYRRGAANYGASIAWALAAYDGWPSRAVAIPRGDRPNCSPTCQVKYAGPAWKFYWAPHGWN